ncbi:hypothetical protein FHS81_002081 [Pseudochelatococcus contaminans]|uniref:Uncharacterized protein n=1 Tax=Pseudochelatococcus contaminans TaxID=1538103 RepID=A0A7W5Z4E8_9HYPH|nr:hypothetical protein [Pseudochelatococcus contaminans]
MQQYPDRRIWQGVVHANLEYQDCAFATDQSHLWMNFATITPKSLQCLDFTIGHASCPYCIIMRQWHVGAIGGLAAD